MMHGRAASDGRQEYSSEYAAGRDHASGGLGISSPRREWGPADLQKAVAMAEGTICPVWAMLKGGCDIVPALKVVAP